MKTDVYGIRKALAETERKALESAVIFCCPECKAKILRLIDLLDGSDKWRTNSKGENLCAS